MKGRKEEGESNEQTWGEARRRKQRFRKRALMLLESNAESIAPSIQ